MEFETDRFIIRKLKAEDISPFYEMQGNENVMRYIKPALNYEESKIELEKFISYYNGHSRFFLLWAVESKRDQAFVGMCGVYHNELKENEIAYRLLEKYWGKGIGKEIAFGLIKHCQSGMKMEKLVAHADEDNVGSVRILENTMDFVERYYDKERVRFSRKYVLC